jgi:5-methyltetrahydrofolate--homocysteine methyltransferase
MGGNVETVLKSADRTVIISPERPTVLVGERINPTGRKRLAESLRGGDLSVVRREAIAQAEAGADILDINVGAEGVDEAELLPEAVRTAMEVADVPLAFDTSSVEAISETLSMYRREVPEGIPLVNSVNGETARLAQVLPLVKEYGTAVIGLCMDDEGIPSSAERRFEIASRIVEEADNLGIPQANVIIDCLAMAVAADESAAHTTLETARRVREGLGVNITLGASNTSFGLPDRKTVDQAFLVLAIQAGVNCPIVDAARTRPAVVAADLLLGRDEFATRYIGAYRQRIRAQQES